MMPSPGIRIVGVRQEKTYPRLSSERAASRKAAGWNLKECRRRGRVKHRRAYAAPLAKPISRVTIRDC